MDQSLVDFVEFSAQGTWVSLGERITVAKEVVMEMVEGVVT